MNKMKIEKTDLDGVLLITPPVCHEDFRGTNTEIYNDKMMISLRLTRGSRSLVFLIGI